MKSETVIATLRAFLNGKPDDAINYLAQMIAHERHAGNTTLAHRLERLLDCQTPQLIKLPDGPPSLCFINPVCSLGSMVLSPAVQRAVESLVREWRGRERLAEHGLKPRNVVLLHGPSGNGKTALAEAIAQAVSLPFGIVKYESVIDSYRGRTLKNVSDVFRFMRSTPCVVLFDEADSIISSRIPGARDSGKEDNRSVNALLVELDHLPPSSLVVFATNMRGDIDTALSRRIGLELEMGPPVNGERERMINAMAARWPFIKGGGWAGAALSASSFAEIESLALGCARETILATAE